MYRETPIAALDLRASRWIPVLPAETWISSARVVIPVERQTNPVAQLYCLVRPIPQRCSKSEAIQDLPGPGLKAIGVTTGNRATILFDNDGVHSCSCQPCCESQTSGMLSVARSRQVIRQSMNTRTLMGPLQRLPRPRVSVQASFSTCC